jgi:hypothetical protein
MKQQRDTIIEKLTAYFRNVDDVTFERAAEFVLQAEACTPPPDRPVGRRFAVGDIVLPLNPKKRLDVGRVTALAGPCVVVRWFTSKQVTREWTATLATSAEVIVAFHRARAGRQPVRTRSVPNKEAHAQSTSATVAVLPQVMAGLRRSALGVGQIICAIGGMIIFLPIALAKDLYEIAELLVRAVRGHKSGALTPVHPPGKPVPRVRK